MASTAAPSSEKTASLRAADYADLSPEDASEAMTKAGVSFEAALRALNEQVEALEQTDLGLDDAIEIYAFGAQLRHFCERRLREAEMKIEQLTTAAGEATGTKPFDG
ncbi:MAG: exodeoxyribonuclease VII small subunit [Alphaproteobacteria bacterium]|nr:exodeoxyribonuclease VII small subunit [Alphaproteobacteria bacterium]